MEKITIKDILNKKYPKNMGVYHTIEQLEVLIKEVKKELLEEIKTKIKYQKINGHGSLVKGLCRNDIKYILEILQEFIEQCKGRAEIKGIK